jgi:glycosyltransferase involved in cell wall biosynthesis
MRITAYSSHENAAALRTAPEERTWVETNEAAYAGLALGSVNGKGFDLLCPHGFEATWNGGPYAEDVEIRLATGASPPGFVQSRRGEGLLTFYPGHQFKTEDEQALWVRGPVNAPKDGLAPLEIIIDTSVLPCTFTMHWKFTRAQQTIRFEAGEPFCTVLPYPKGGLDEVALDVVRLGDADAFVQAFQQLIDAPAVASVFRRLGATAAEPASPDQARPPGQRRADPEEIPFPPPVHVIPPPRALSAARAERLFRGGYPARISVILPAANESVLLQRTVEQFAATLPPDSEIIVVDNGSTDGCAEFLLAENGDNVQLIRTPEPLGVAAARNRGLAQARGEIVVFADAHIDVPAHWWQPLVSTLNRPDVGVVGPGIGVMGNPHRRASCGQRIAEPKLRLEWLPWKSDEPYPVPCLGGGFMAMRHETLTRAGAFDDGMTQWGSEDMELCVRYWQLGHEVFVAPEVTVLHYFRKAQAYKVESRWLVHNLLRVALLHFNQARIARVLTALRNHARFGPALALAVDSDVWQKRAEFAARRVRDDDWLFEKFADCCQV